MNHLIEKSSPTMSSRDISALTGKEHKNVLRTIRDLIAADVLAAQIEPLKFEYRGQHFDYYELNKRDSLVLVARLSPEFTAAIVDRWQELESSALPVSKNTDVEAAVGAGIRLLESAKKTLNLSNSSMLGGYQKLQRMAGLPDLMPVYAIDAPAGAADGSSRSTKSLRTLLVDAGITMSAAIAYVRLEAAGLVERKSRPSTTKGEKKFWCVTTRGMEFGKNMTSPANPRETQCHWYETKIPEILKIISEVAK